MADDKNTMYPTALPPATLDMLRDAVDFASEGRPLSKQFLDELSRQVNSIQERSDLVQVVVDSHQTERMAATFRRLAKTEQFLFDNPEEGMSFEKQMEAMEPVDRLRLLALLYKEAGILAHYQRERRDKAAPISAPNAIEEVSQPLTDEQKAAQQAGKAVTPEGRERIKDFIDRLKRDVIDVKSEEVDESTPD